MLFSDPLFLFGFLPAAWLAWMAVATQCEDPRAAPAVVILFSLLFYVWLRIEHTGLLLGSIAFNWAMGRLLARSPTGSAKSTLLVATGVASNLLLLGVYKYAGFLSGGAIALALPLAISFFTFQQVSYLVDARRTGQDEPGILNYALAVTFFAHLIAGPIIRYREFRRQLNRFRKGRTTGLDLRIAAFLIVTGLAKKLLVADSLAPIVDAHYASSPQAIGDAGAPGALLAAFAFYLQIYFDFSGYTDIAIGLARLFTIRFPNNFDDPYRAASVSDFWRRWHITLSRFLRDYLYIPLGGSRGSAGRRAFALLATMVLGGLWHGAAWNFLLWGFVHGMALVALHAWRLRGGPAIRPALAWAGTQLFILFSWIAFRAPSLESARATLLAVFALRPTLRPDLVDAFYGGPAASLGVSQALGAGGVLVFLACAFALSVLPSRRFKQSFALARSWVAASALWGIAGAVAFVLWSRFRGLHAIEPFLYFQF